MQLFEILLLVLQVEVVDKVEQPPLGLHLVFEILIGIGPVLIAVCSIIQNHFSWGIKYTIMQGAAERIRGQIFKYRSRTGKYHDKNYCARRLADAMTRITGDVQRSECQNVTLQSLDPPRDRNRPPQAKEDWYGIRAYLFTVVHNNPEWEKADFTLIISSSACLGLSFVTLPYEIITFLLNSNFGFNLFFAVAFTIQLLMNGLGFGLRQFWRQYWMRFDTFVVIIGWVGYIVDLGHYARAVRMLRLLRVGKLLVKSGGAMAKNQRAKTLNLYHADEAVTMIDAHEYITYRLEHVMQEIKKEIIFLYAHYYFFAMCVCIMTGVVTIFGILDLGERAGSRDVDVHGDVTSLLTVNTAFTSCSSLQELG